MSVKEPGYKVKDDGLQQAAFPKPDVRYSKKMLPAGTTVSIWTGDKQRLDKEPVNAPFLHVYRMVQGLRRYTNKPVVGYITVPSKANT